MCKESGESIGHLLLHCDFAHNLLSWYFTCLESIGLCHRGCWICWLVGKRALVDIVMLTHGGQFPYAPCGLFGENATSLLLKGSNVCLWS
jgi:hypothetical protein